MRSGWVRRADIAECGGCVALSAPSGCTLIYAYSETVPLSSVWSMHGLRFRILQCDGRCHMLMLNW